MKGKIASLLFLFFQPLFLYSQFHEVGVFLGSSNYIGDVGGPYFVNPNSSAFGVYYRWNVNTRYSFRAGLMTSKIQASDYNSSDLNRFRRGFKFNNNIQEVYAGVEFNFLDFNLHDDSVKLSPYLFLGMGYFLQDLFYIKESNFTLPTNISYGKAQNVSLPVIVGVKFNPNPLWVLGVEIGARYTFTDNIDGSDPIGEFEGNQVLKYGNLSNNDWYVFTGLTFSFTFGDLPCYCKE